MNNEDLKRFWESIPVGKENAVPYPVLMVEWQMNERAVRMVLHDLSCYDSEDDLVLIRSSRNKGFYRTNNPSEMREFRKECLEKGRSLFAPVHRINQLLKEDENRPDLFDFGFLTRQNSAN